MPVYSCPDVFRLTALHVPLWFPIFLIAFLTLACDITQVWFGSFTLRRSHRNFLRWPFLFFITHCGFRESPDHRRASQHPKSMLLSPQLITEMLENIWHNTHSLEPFIRNLSIKGCSSDTHLLYPLMIRSTSLSNKFFLQQFGIWRAESEIEA